MKCLSNHLSSFAVIAEDITIEIPTIAANDTTATATTATTPTATTQSTVITDVSTSMNVITCIINEIHINKL